MTNSFYFSTLPVVIFFGVLYFHCYTFVGLGFRHYLQNLANKHVWQCSNHNFYSLCQWRYTSFLLKKKRRNMRQIAIGFRYFQKSFWIMVYGAKELSSLVSCVCVLVREENEKTDRENIRVCTMLNMFWYGSNELCIFVHGPWIMVNICVLQQKYINISR